jgi:hypothetical protein
MSTHQCPLTTVIGEFPEDRSPHNSADVCFSTPSIPSAAFAGRLLPRRRAEVTRFTSLTHANPSISTLRAPFKAHRSKMGAAV